MVPDSAKPLARIACAFEQYSVAGSQIAAKPCKKNMELCSLICAVQIKERLLWECHACQKPRGVRGPGFRRSGMLLGGSCGSISVWPFRL